MRFERGFRSIAMKPYPEGYFASSTEDVNRQEPTCHLGGMKDGGSWIGLQDFPYQIEINVRVIPIWVDNQTASATLDKELPCLIYPLTQVFSCVRIESQDNGYYLKNSGEEKKSFRGNKFLNYFLELPTPYLYQKNFLTQPIGQKVIGNAQNRVREDVPSLWAYGAQQLGEDVHPFVFSLDSVRQETCLRPSSLLSWRERGIFPTLVGQTMESPSTFQDLYEEDQTRTLMESIEAGMSIIYLHMNLDEKGMVCKIPYYSYRLAQNHIIYKKGESFHGNRL